MIQDPDNNSYLMKEKNERSIIDIPADEHGRLDTIVIRNLVFDMEGHRPLESRPTWSKCLVHSSFDPKYSWDFGNYLYLPDCQQTEGEITVLWR